MTELITPLDKSALPLSSTLWLTLDMGNTEVKLGCYDLDRQRFVHLERLPRTATFSIEPEPYEGLTTLLKKYLLTSSPGVKGVSFCTVIPGTETWLPELLHTLTAGHLPCIHATPLHANALNATIHLGSYPASQLGPDRWVDLVGAQASFPNETLLVIDFGTATTLDVLSATGEFLGGVIAPGWRLFVESLPAKTARLPEVVVWQEATLPQTAVGTSTTSALEIGIIHGYLGLLYSLMGGLLSTVWNLQTPQTAPGMRPRILATGGAAQRMQTLLQEATQHPPYAAYAQGLCAAYPEHGTRLQIDTVDPWLTHRGLLHLALPEIKAKNASTLCEPLKG